MSDMIGFVKTAGLKKRYSICILSVNSGFFRKGKMTAKARSSHAWKDGAFL